MTFVLRHHEVSSLGRSILFYAPELAVLLPVLMPLPGWYFLRSTKRKAPYYPTTGSRQFSLPQTVLCNVPGSFARRSSPSPIGKHPSTRRPIAAARSQDVAEQLAESPFQNYVPVIPLLPCRRAGLVQTTHQNLEMRPWNPFTIRRLAATSFCVQTTETRSVDSDASSAGCGV